MRARFRHGFGKPVPFRPNQVESVEFELPDVLHTFKPGHRVMVQVQSTWFPLVDRNPQKYVPNIFEAKDSDFQTAEQRIWRSPSRPSHVSMEVLMNQGSGRQEQERK